ncbi:MAG: ATP-dependent zinc metalloprotease FtsH [Armatimonadetes bacterium]|nr:ATP-dependent zinc metalloprotease FtsH [Armatimonadota bacterium]
MQMEQKDAPDRLDFGRLMQEVEKGNVKSLTITPKNIGEGEYVVNGTTRKFVVNLPAEQDAYVARLDGKVTNITFEQPSISDVWVSGLFYLLITGLLIVGFWIFLMRQSQSSGSQALSFGRSKARRLPESSPKVTFDDVAGVEEAKAELLEVVEFLKNPRKFQALGARIPKGVLLVGPPGSGKTLLARAIAGEAGVPFFHMSGSEFVEMFVGVGASRVRDLFEQAKANRPCIVFIDEIDAVGRQRFAGLGGGHDEREQTLNQLLVEMDGFEPNSRVVLISATNRPDVLDPALLRPGRFDRRIQVDNPDLKGRIAITKVHMKGKPLADDVDLDVLGRRTPGFSGADLANLTNEAALLAARRDKDKIGMAELEDSIERVVAGPERKGRIISEQERKILAQHEVGHAVLAELLPRADPVHKVSILQRGLALGYTLQLPQEDRYIMSRSELLDRITVFLGGRVSEELAFQEISTGAADDIKKATEMARRMVTDFGMSSVLGPVSLGRKSEQTFLGRDLMEDRNYSEQVASAIDKELSTIIEDCYERAKALLTEHTEDVRKVVEILLERETLSGDEIRMVMRGEELPPKVEPEPEKPAESVKPEAEDGKEPSVGGEQPQVA